MGIAKEFTKGLWKEIPPFRLVLGLCPILAVTKTAFDGFGMGLATTFVLVCSNVLVSILRNVIPSKVRIASFILIIATFVTIVDLAMKAWAYQLSQSLGLFIPLIVVNCIVLGRAEAFASKNSVPMSLADGLGMGLGYTMSLFALGSVREILGSGALSRPSLTISPFNLAAKDVELVSGFFEKVNFQPFSFAVEAPGAFVFLGLMLGMMTLMSKK
ncbi:electron transport complex subunit RsxE [bacterium]